MTLSSKMRKQVFTAVLAGLALRLLFILRFRAGNGGDALYYVQLAQNWLWHGVYGLWVGGKLVPVDMRAPGYPAFLASTFALFGNSQQAAMLAQAVIDLGTCILIARLAARLAPERTRRRVALAGLWLAALCPFTANYTAALLTETVATFLTALALLVLLETEVGGAAALKGRAFLRSPWFLAGLIVGFGTLVRPETPLVAIAAGIVAVIQWWPPSNWGKLVRSGALLGFGLVLPLLPWGARNWRTLHEVQLIAPRYAELPGELVPRGFRSWTGTWLWRMRDVYVVSWKLDVEEIAVEDMPASAFDSAEERARVADLLEGYNQTTTLTAEQDRAFGQIARERTGRHPLRTYLRIPLLRILTLWFCPRTELLPLDGHLWPPGESWENDPMDFSVTLGLSLLNAILLALAVAGAWLARKQPGWALLVGYIVVRTAFFTRIETPEPRYMLECFPVLLALAAQVWSRPPHRA